jgi:hypothetical protein
LETNEVEAARADLQHALKGFESCGARIDAEEASAVMQELDQL